VVHSRPTTGTLGRRRNLRRVSWLPTVTVESEEQRKIDIRNLLEDGRRAIEYQRRRTLRRPEYRAQPEISLRGQVRKLEEDEREKMKLEQERSLGSSHVVVGGGAVRHLDHLRQGESDQLLCERPSGSSHVEDRGGTARELEHLEDLVEAVDQGRGLWQLVDSRPCLEVECQ
jgi:hypothetical protein